MSKIFRIVFYCCNKTEETKEEIEQVEKKNPERNPLPLVRNKSQRPYSEERPQLSKNIDSSESCSISSGSNNNN